MTDKPLVNRKKGEFAIQLNDEWIVLKASFGNIALFEENASQGVYELAQKVSENKIRMTDIVNVIYCFSVDKKLDRDDIAFALQNSGPQIAIQAIAGFLGVMFNVDDAAMNEAVNNTVEDNKKK